MSSQDKSGQDTDDDDDDRRMHISVLRNAEMRRAKVYDLFGKSLPNKFTSC